MADLIVVVIIAAFVGGAVYYIRKQKKSGAHCIGCPSSGQCSKNHTESCHCGCGFEKQK